MGIGPFGNLEMKDLWFDMLGWDAVGIGRWSVAMIVARWWLNYFPFFLGGGIVVWLLFSDLGFSGFNWGSLHL